MVSVDVDQEVDPLPEDCLFTLEELDRFRGLESLESSEDLKKSKGQFEPPKAFILPFKADDIALAMVSFGNLFIDERGVIPTAKELAGYMLDVGRKELQMMYDDRDKDSIFGVKPLSERRFKARYKDYFGGTRVFNDDAC